MNLGKPLIFFTNMPKNDQDNEHGINETHEPNEIGPQKKV